MFFELNRQIRFPRDNAQWDIDQSSICTDSCTLVDLLCVSIFMGMSCKYNKMKTLGVTNNNFLLNSIKYYKLRGISYTLTKYNYTFFFFFVAFLHS